MTGPVIESPIARKFDKRKKSHKMDEIKQLERSRRTE